MRLPSSLVLGLTLGGLASQADARAHGRHARRGLQRRQAPAVSTTTPQGPSTTTQPASTTTRPAGSTTTKSGAPTTTNPAPGTSLTSTGGSTSASASNGPASSSVNPPSSSGGNLQSTTLAVSGGSASTTINTSVLSSVNTPASSSVDLPSSSGNALSSGALPEVSTTNAVSTSEGSSPTTTTNGVVVVISSTGTTTLAMPDTSIATTIAASDTSVATSAIDIDTTTGLDTSATPQSTLTTIFVTSSTPSSSSSPSTSTSPTDAAPACPETVAGLCGRSSGSTGTTASCASSSGEVFDTSCGVRLIGPAPTQLRTAVQANKRHSKRQSAQFIFQLLSECQALCSQYNDCNAMNFFGQICELLSEVTGVQYVPGAVAVVRSDPTVAITPLDQLPVSQAPADILAQAADTEPSVSSTTEAVDVPTDSPSTTAGDEPNTTVDSTPEQTTGVDSTPEQTTTADSVPEPEQTTSPDSTPEQTTGLDSTPDQSTTVDSIPEQTTTTDFTPVQTPAPEQTTTADVGPTDGVDQFSTTTAPDVPTTTQAPGPSVCNTQATYQTDPASPYRVFGNYNAGTLDDCKAECQDASSCESFVYMPPSSDSEGRTLPSNCFGFDKTLTEVQDDAYTCAFCNSYDMSCFGASSVDPPITTTTTGESVTTSAPSTPAPSCGAVGSWNQDEYGSTPFATVGECSTWCNGPMSFVCRSYSFDGQRCHIYATSFPNENFTAADTGATFFDSSCGRAPAPTGPVSSCGAVGSWNQDEYGSTPFANIDQCSAWCNGPMSFVCRAYSYDGNRCSIYATSFPNENFTAASTGATFFDSSCGSSAVTSCGAVGNWNQDSYGSTPYASVDQCKAWCTGPMSFVCRSYSFDGSTCTIYPDTFPNAHFVPRSTGATFFDSSCATPSTGGAATTTTTTQAATTTTAVPACDNRPFVAPNGGFESGSMLPWSIGVTGETSSVVGSTEGQLCHSGNYCLHQTASPPPDGSRGGWAGAEVSWVDTCPGTTYLLTVWVRAGDDANTRSAPGACAANVQFNLDNTGTGFRYSDNTVTFPDTTSWQVISGSFTATNARTLVYLHTSCNTEDTRLNVYWDDVTLTPALVQNVS